MQARHARSTRCQRVGWWVVARKSGAGSVRARVCGAVCRCTGKGRQARSACVCVKGVKAQCARKSSRRSKARGGSDSAANAHAVQIYACARWRAPRKTIHAEARRHVGAFATALLPRHVCSPESVAAAVLVVCARVMLRRPPPPAAAD